MNWHNDSVTSLFRACTSIVTQKWNIFPTPGRVLLIQLYDVKLVFVDEPRSSYSPSSLHTENVGSLRWPSASYTSTVKVRIRGLSLKSQNWVNFFHEWISFNLLQNMSKRIGMVQFGLDRKGSRHTTDTFSHFDISDLKEILGMFHKVTWNTVSFFLFGKPAMSNNLESLYKRMFFFSFETRETKGK